jgi:type III secretion system (T3SS) SseB-like protein
LIHKSLVHLFTYLYCQEHSPDESIQLFKKKNSEHELGNLSLEELLQNAATKPECRPEFYKRLLSDRLVVITTDNGKPDREWVAKENTSVNIVNLSDGRIPVFTTKEKIFDKGIIKEQVKVLELKGDHLFTTKGATLILNLYSDYGKELLPAEIEQMLNGTILTSTHQKITVGKETSVQIAQPANYPTEIVNALSNFIF